MKHAPPCAPACWAHHSWLPSGQPVRDERAARAAHAFLFSRYPQWVERIRTDLPRDLPPILPLWPRPACARLCRVVAALAFARSLRRVVTVEARARFARSVAPRLLGALQRHLRADAADLGLDVDVDLDLDLDPDLRLDLGLDGDAQPSPSLFERRDMTALGLALAGCAAADAREAFWWSVRLPREIAETAARYRVRGLSPADARALLADARRLMEGQPC